MIMASKFQLEKACGINTAIETIRHAVGLKVTAALPRQTLHLFSRLRAIDDVVDGGNIM
jgi:predicted metal-dependent phosphoesterase TrpH